MDCRHTRTYLDLYLDAELDLKDRVDIDLHLSNCPNCRRFFAQETDLRVAFRRQMAPVSAPRHLRAAILSAIASEEAEPTLWDRIRAGLAWTVPATLAAGIAVLSVWPFEPRSTAAPLTSAGLVAVRAEPALATGASLAPVPVRRAVTLASFQGLGADVRGGAPEIREYLAARLPFDAELPLVPADGLRLVGAREVSFEERRAALFIYDLKGHRVTFVQKVASEADLRSPDLVVAREGAISTGHFVHGRLVNTVVTDLDPALLAQLIESNRP